MDLHIENRKVTVPTLRSARLVLRDLRPDDLDAVTLLANDFEVSKWLVPVPFPYARADADDFLRMDITGELGLLWVILRDDVLIGVVSTGKELGYWLGQPFWGQGYMTEAAQAAVDHSFAASDMDKMHSSHFTENHGSRRVLEKLGFQDVGGHVHFSNARQADVPGRSMLLTRDRWVVLQDV
ncbi:hypothetical protein AL073_03595 [Loktanella sp. 1ANDIMAR09]|nr:hypothetical protein AL073_03595 [Loktanella sp. 1ANDIMAR09]